MTPREGEPIAKAVQEEEYCAYCGTDVHGAAPVPRRFGEPFCSEAHADSFAQEAWATRIERAASSDPTSQAVSAGGSASSGWDLKRALKMAACCGLPLLALVFLAGGGGALLGAGAAVLPVLAVLACPLGMFFMMRAMQGHGRDDRHASAERSPPRVERASGQGDG